MVRVKIGDELVQSKIRFRVRFDFKGEYRPGKFLFGGKPIELAAQENREEQVALLRNLPIQGAAIEDYDITLDPYITQDDQLGERIAYAPALLTIMADTVEDMVRFVTREEFRKLEILEPSQMMITSNDLERMLFCMSEELRRQMIIYSKKIKR